MMEKTAVSPFNFDPEVVADFNFNPKLEMVDCTLRDGEQQAGVVFTSDDKIRIATKLNSMKMHEIEAGMPVSLKEEQKTFAEIVKKCNYSRIVGIARTNAVEIDFLADCGAWGATVSLPVGRLQREYKVKMTDDEYIATMLKWTEYAKNKGLHVTFSPYDSPRADKVFLDRLLHEIAKSGTIDRLRLVDTVGSTHPEAIYYLVRYYKGIIGDIAIEVHCHNDFGLAVANTISGAKAGAEILSTTINGLGERSGNTSCEEVLAALKFLYNVDIGIDMTQLKEVSELVEELSGVKLQQHKAVVGKHSFSHESGMVVSGLLKCPFTAEAYAPELVGQKREILVGKGSGAASIKSKLESFDIHFSREIIDQITNEVKEHSTRFKRCLKDSELIDIAGKYK